MPVNFALPRSSRRLCWWLIVAGLLSTNLAQAQVPAHVDADTATGLPINNTRTCAPDGIALGGYDPVSYFDDELPKRPLRGDPQFTVVLGDLTYHFASAANRDAFARAPAEFLPTYQGWCSATLAMGRLACPDFTNFKIEQGKLLLFEVIGFTNGRDAWNSDPIASKTNADRHYHRLLNE